MAPPRPASAEDLREITRRPRRYATDLVVGGYILHDGFTWTDYLAAKTFFDTTTATGAENLDGKCLYKQQPDPTAAPTSMPTTPKPSPAPTLAEPAPTAETGKPTFKPTFKPTDVQAVIALESSVVVEGVEPDAFNSDPDMQEAMKGTIAQSATTAEYPIVKSDITEISAASTRRRLQSGGVEISYTIELRVEATDDAASIADDFLEAATAALTTAVTSGSFATTLQAAAVAFASVTVDVTATTAAIEATTTTFIVTTPTPTVATGGGGGGGSAADMGPAIGGAAAGVFVVGIGGSAAYMKMKGLGPFAGSGGAKIQASPN